MTSDRHAQRGRWQRCIRDRHAPAAPKIEEELRLLYVAMTREGYLDLGVTVLLHRATVRHGVDRHVYAGRGSHFFPNALPGYFEETGSAWRQRIAEGEPASNHPQVDLAARMRKIAGAETLGCCRRRHGRRPGKR